LKRRATHLNKIGRYNVRICCVWSEYVPEMTLVYAHELSEPPAPDGERLWDVKEHSNFPRHAVRPYFHHKLKWEHSSLEAHN
jgi:hypothetical protein